jgi:transposase
MIPIPTGVRAWLATGYTDMRRGFHRWRLYADRNLLDERCRSRGLAR